MKKKQSLDRRLMISKNSILMLVILVTVFMAIWAWFASGTEATANGLSVGAKTPATLDIAMPDESGLPPAADSTEWKSEINFNNMSSIQRIMENDVTSDGLHFIIPATKMASGTRSVVDDDSDKEEWVRATAGVDYVSIPIYVRSENKNVYVSSTSALEATLTDSSGATVNQSTEDLTKYNGSRNAIAGAVRVSVVDMTGSLNVSEAAGVTNVAINNNYNPLTFGSNLIKMVWIPRPDLYLDTSASVWALKTNVTKTTTLAGTDTADDTYIHRYWQIHTADEKTLNEGKLVDKTYYAGAKASPFIATDVTPTLGENVQIGNGKKWMKSETDTNTEETIQPVTMNGKSYYLYKFVINLWIEGEDAEARRALNEGEFSLRLNFCTDL